MADANALLDKIPLNLGSAGGIADLLLAVIIGFFGLILVFYILWFMIKKKMQWNLKVEFKIPRDMVTLKDENGKDIIRGSIRKEWGKGFYDAKRGVVFIKRPGKGRKAVPMKPFNIKEYLSGKQSILTVIQVGIEDYRPVLDDSYIEATSTEPLRDEDGDILVDEKGREVYEKAALINAKIDISESKSWRNTFEREAKATYAVGNFLQKYQQYIGFAILFFSIFLGFSVIYSKIT